ncbi:MAG TPA: hypothetical protein VEH77_03845, partial [Roseiarcus sp.]|nr:hypothetical protein [Roseiarcus sp.]
AWAGFLHGGAIAREALEKDWIGDQKMQSVFAATRLLGAPLGFAYALQGLAALAALAALAPLASRAHPGPAAAAAVVPASLLASPFLLDYDLMLIAIPLAWLAGEGRRTGFLPWEKAGLIAGFLLPLVSRLAATAVGLPLGPPTMAAVFALALRRCRLPATAGAAAPGATAARAGWSEIQRL